MAEGNAEAEEQRKKNLDLNLLNLQKEYPERYSVYRNNLLKEQIRAGERRTGDTNVPIGDRERLFKAAQSGLTANPLEMERKEENVADWWEK